MNIDLKGALANLGNSPKLYRTLITGFIEKYSHIDNEIYELIIQRKIEEARRMAHSLKGLCGNLGTGDLQDSAMTLETDLKQYLVKPISDEEVERIIESSWYEFSVNLGKVLPILVSLLQANEENFLEAVQVNDLMSFFHPAHNEVHIVNLPQETGEEMVKRLLNAINTYNYERINEVLESVNDEVMHKIFSITWDLIKIHIKNYEYDEAKSIILKGINDEN